MPMLTWLPLFATACGPSPARPGPAEQEQGTLQLQVTALRAQQQAHARVAWAEAGAAVQLWGGLASGKGPCFSWLDGACLEIEDAQPIASGEMGADGTALLSFPVPALAAGEPYLLQATVQGADAQVSRLLA